MRNGSRLRIVCKSLLTRTLNMCKLSGMSVMSGMSDTHPFDRHGITHLSPSSLALYRAAPALWGLRYLFGVRDETGAFAARGKAVEAALAASVTETASENAAIPHALSVFSRA